MVADAKSRFADIIDEINLDADEFIKAIKDAIEAARKGGGVVTTSKPAIKPTPTPTVIESEDDDLSDIAPDDDEDIFDDEPVTEENKLIKLDKARLDAIRAAFRTADATVKKDVKKYLANYDNKLAEEMYESDILAIETLLQI